MPGGFPLGLEWGNGASLVGASSAGVSVTPSGTANTKGAYVTLIAACPMDSCWVNISVFRPGTGSFLFDVAIGAAGAERVILSNILIQRFIANDSTMALFLFPLHISRGQRLSARCQSATASDSAIQMSLQLFEGSFTQITGYAGCDGIGAVTGTSRGTLITSGGANTKGSYTQLVALAANDYSSFHISFDNQGTTSADRDCLLDIAVGSAGQEKIIIPDIGFHFESASASIYPATQGPYFVPVPRGSRIAARLQASAATQSTGIVLSGTYQ